jgi:hypothetical protein
MANYYLITTFVILLAGAEATDKAQLGSQHLPNQGAATSREGRLARQRSGGLGRDVQLVAIRGVQSPLRAELAQSMEQAIGAPLQGERSCPQEPEASMIHSFSLSVSFLY